MASEPKRRDRRDPPEPRPGDRPNPMPPVDILRKQKLRDVADKPDETQPFDPRRG